VRRVRRLGKGSGRFTRRKKGIWGVGGGGKEGGLVGGKRSGMRAFRRNARFLPQCRRGLFLTVFSGKEKIRSLRGGMEKENGGFRKRRELSLMGKGGEGIAIRRK